MNLRDFDYLIALAEQQHFGKAAKRCHVSQPTLSMQIKKLERELGVSLIERNRKQFRLTLSAEKIIEHIRQIQQQIKNIKEIGLLAQDSLAGNVYLGAIPTVAPYLLPKIMPKLTHAFPKINFFLIEAQTERLLEMLHSGKCDCAILALPINDTRLQVKTLLSEDFLLAVPTTHPFAKKTTIKLEELRKETPLLLEEGHCLREQALEICQQVGTLEYDSFKATSLETLRQMVAANLGVTLVPEMAALPTKNCVYLPFAKKAPQRKIALVWRNAHLRDRLFNLMVSLLVNEDIQK